MYQSPTTFRCVDMFLLFVFLHLITFSLKFQYNRNNNSCSQERRFCRLGLAREEESEKTSTCQINGVSLGGIFFSRNSDIDNAVRVLYKRVLDGEKGAQEQIDSYIYAELLFRERPGSIIFGSDTKTGYVELLRSRFCNGIHSDNLPDIGNFIRSVVFFSGDEPCVSFDSELPLIACIYDALPNIKRTKQLKARLDPLVGNGSQLSAIVSILLGTLLGLFPRTAKAPYFRRRCDIVGCVREIQCLPETQKAEALRKIPNIVKLCFMEYVQFCIVTYMPVEHEVMMKGATTDTFLNTLPGVCDIFRLQINDLECFNLSDIDKIAVQCVERCYRLCKFKMRRHATTKGVSLPCFKKVNWVAFLDALEIVEYDYLLNSHKICGKRGGILLDSTRELRLMLPDAPDEVLRYACAFQQTFKTYKLPETLTTKQMLSLRRQYSHCQNSQEAVSKFFVCLGCVVTGRGQKQLFRYSCRNGIVECARCQNPYSVLEIEMLGSILYFCGQVLIMCHSCLEILTLGHFDFGVDSGCRNCCRRLPCQETVCKKSRKKRKPCFYCCFPSNNTLTLLESKTLCIQNVHVCNKHTPPSHICKYICEVSDCACLCTCLRFNIPLFMQVSQLLVWCGAQ